MKVPSNKNCLDLFHYIEHLNVEYVADLVFFRCLGRAFNSNSVVVAVFSHSNKDLGFSLYFFGLKLKNWGGFIII